jgi:hypothetical protein
MTVSSAMQLSSRIGGIEVSRSMVARERARRLRAEGRDIIDLTAAYLCLAIATSLRFSKRVRRNARAVLP